MIRTVARFICILSAGLLLASCASISVQDGTESIRQKKPEIVYVMDFSTKGSDFEVDRLGKELADFKSNLQLMLKTAVAADLSDRLLPSVTESKMSNARARNAWLVLGRFTKVRQGSRLLRSAIGFGAGGTKLETKVEVYDLDENPGAPFLTFSTTGGSGAEPGAILAFSTDPVQLAIGAVSGAAHGLSEDTARTAREITAELSNYMYHRGWIPEDEWIEPKHQRATDTW